MIRFGGNPFAFGPVGLCSGVARSQTLDNLRQSAHRVKEVSQKRDKQIARKEHSFIYEYATPFVRYLRLDKLATWENCSLIGRITHIFRPNLVTLDRFKRSFLL